MNTQRALPTLLIACLAAGALACGSKDQRPAVPLPIQQQVALHQAASCEDLGASVQEAAVRQMRSQLDLYKNGYYWGPVGAGGTPTASPAADGAGGPVAYTTTNTQVAGVDEGDFFKNDGTRILVLQGSSLLTAKSWPPKDLALAGKLQIEGWPQQMLLDGDTAVVFSTVWSQPVNSANDIACPYYAGMGMGAFGVGMPYCGGDSTTKVTIVDLTTLSAPKAKAELYFPGWSNEVRKSGSSVRMVLSDSIRWPAGVRWWPDWSVDYQNNPALFSAAISKLEDDNEALIRATPAQAWLPSGKRKLEGGATIELGYACSDFYISNASEAPGLLTVATIDLADLTQPPTRTSVLGDSGVVYATAERLYVASAHWWGWWFAGQQDWTYLHAFDLTDPKKASYLASGGVVGHVLNQFSLDESGGFLRIATTTITRENGAEANTWSLKAGNRVSVLQQDGGKLTVVGDTGTLVADETIRAVRMVKDRGYVVTFRGIDPLITVDLSNPGAPKKIGELTLPGFSTYLEPVDDTHLLAIGVDLPEPDPVTGATDWSRRAVQLSLFDVSDLAHPKRTASLPIGSTWAWTEAMYDHHAFNWYPQRGLLALPFADWTNLNTAPWYGQFKSDVQIFNVDPAKGITALGGLGMADIYRFDNGYWSPWYQPWVRRSVMATDDLGWDWVYAVSDAGIRVASLSDLKHPVATALFPYGP
jgi:hypothetical protein